MSYDPKNNRSSSDWDFDEPDWLADLLAEADNTAKSEPRPEPVPVPEPSQAKAPSAPAPEKPLPKAPSAAAREKSHRPQAAAHGRTSRPAAPSPDWEKARRSGNTGKPAGRSPRRRRGTNVPVILLVVLLVGGMLFAAWQLGSIFLNYSRDRSAYNDLAANALSGIDDKKEPDVVISDPEVVPEMPEATPFVSEIPFQVDWDYLSSINSDIIGWLYCEDTVINYPVVQTPDHDFYLNHGFDGNSNTSGALFADRDSVAGVTQSNLIIYGHNMKDESMFGILKGYVDKSFYDKHPVFYYLTPTQSYRVELLCAHIVDATDENFPTYFSSSQTQQSYINDITSSAFWINYDAVSTEHQLITLSTCTSAAGKNDPRFLLHGIMIPIQ